MPPMNVITIISDTLRPDHLGHNQRRRRHRPPAPQRLWESSEARNDPWIRTPNLDRFAARAASFDEAYCGSFPTVPARTDLFTGRYTFVSRPWGPLPPGEVVMPRVLSRAGYLTQLIADTPHLFRLGFHDTFDAWDWQRGQEREPVTVEGAPVHYPCEVRKLRLDPDIGRPHCEQQVRSVAGYTYERQWSVARACEAACDWLEAHRRTEAPFYLHLDVFDPHEPWLAPPWYTAQYDPDYAGDAVVAPDCGPCDFLSDRELEHVRALYAAEVTLMDRWVGRVFDKIEDLGLFETTAVFFASDHGFILGEHGLIGKHGFPPYHTWPLYSEISSIAFLASMPDMAPSLRGAGLDKIVQLVDIFPTVLEAAGIPRPVGVPLHGESLLASLTGRGPVQSAGRVAVTSDALPTDPGAVVHSAITDGRWVLIDAGPRRAPVLVDRAYEAPITTGGAVEPPNLIAARPEEAGRLRGAYFALLERCGASARKLALRRGLVGAEQAATVPATRVTRPPAAGRVPSTQ
jgi:arylsulfatase A-like enzyme